jgi:hypothetical protein
MFALTLSSIATYWSTPNISEEITSHLQKLAAESRFCHESKRCQSFFSAQTTRAKGKMTGQNSQQKSFSGRMNVLFALGDMLAHIGPNSGEEHSLTSLWELLASSLPAAISHSPLCAQWYRPRE